MCRDVEEPTSFGPDYFPLEIGNEWIYAIDSTEYDRFTEDATLYQFQRRERITSSFISDDGTTQFLVDVSYKTDTTDWNYFNTITFYKTNYRAVRIDSNRAVMHLLFPVKNRVSWNANQLNSNAEDRFRYLKSEKHNSQLFDSFATTVFVQQEFDTSIIDQNIRWELYAVGIGLVEKRVVSTEKQFGVKEGFDYHWKLISFTN